MTPEKQSRSLELVAKRDSDPKKWTYEAIGLHYNIASSTAYEIYRRTKERMKKSGQISKYISRKYPGLIKDKKVKDMRLG